ncbi:MAG: hypothetical protein RL632_249 [Bacteroidota bacterium]|jgi:hypothetical protein
MDKSSLKVRNAIVRIVGVFETKGSVRTLASKFKQEKYTEEVIDDPKTLDYFKNYWYPEFRDLYFLRQEESSATILTKNLENDIVLVVRTNETTKEKTCISVRVEGAEVFLFKNNLHFFSIDLSIEMKELASYSDLTFVVRNFYTKVLSSDAELNWVNWIEKEVLCDISISGETGRKGPKVDDYSGSKFKVFSIIDLEEIVDQNTRAELLYDLGCGAQIGSAGGQKLFSPSQTYFEELMENKISIFNNYDILPLFDSFTVLGNAMLDEDKTTAKTRTWSQSYFRVFLHNLLIKFNLYRYNSEMINDSVKVRDQFEEFLNTYNISHISYNFLPNLMYQKHRSSLDIDGELKQFQDRITRISESIREQQQSRANALLGLVGIFTSIGSVLPIVNAAPKVQRWTGMNAWVFYSLVGILLISIAIPLLMYLFPEKSKKLKRWWRSRKSV